MRTEDSHGRGAAGHANDRHDGEKTPSKRQERRTQEVWASNLEEEMEKMRDIAEAYPHVSMETQFSGIVARPTGPFRSYTEYNYQTLKCNVDLSRVIQISLTFSDAKGNRPKGISTWRYNFSFNAAKDLYAAEQISRRGIDLSKHQEQGIDVAVFGELLMSSGLVLNEDVKWISHLDSAALEGKLEHCPGRPNDGCGGMYDFGHLLQVLTAQSLPEEVSGYFESLDLFFPSRCGGPVAPPPAGSRSEVR
eukprot:gnl/TRDRNA2_/TRDRNA2_191506_c0_seq1.p1 gnl/TRDRNA2_/TRDRNA2_191506_c0~~gnl/TRDRNA2_/TRDRNA2_191506_c0_seq1.p1  ORF type:complete len:249 (-),score=25.96 gnl/TRDRNA2_/TRDRNA2_191506_c0_seq1:87-833(-)